MTVSSNQASETFNCDGVTVAFTCPFRVLAATEMRVYLVTAATGARSLLTNGVDYTVTGAGTAANVTVTTVATYSNLYQIQAKRRTARLQETDYRDNDPFPAESHETALDRLTMIAQEDEEAIGRAVRAPEGETLAEMADAANRALKYLGFDADGNPTLLTASAGTALALAAQLINTALTAEGDAMIGVKRTDIAGVATSLHAWMNAQIFNVKSDGGATGDGTTDDTAAIQDIADKINTLQTAMITAEKLTKVVMYFPDGNYRLTAAVKIHGFVAIMGPGVAYNGGAVMHQATEGENIFEFYGSANDNTSLGVTVEGMNFEFDKTFATSTGVALYFPKNDDVVPANVLSSNSHYIRRNRFGGWHSKGRFVRMFNCNDVEISGNTIDVCESHAIELGDDASATSRVTDARIFGNGFYYCFSGITLRNVAGVSIGNNAFFTQFSSDWAGITMRSSGAIVASRIEGVTITGNTFGRCFTAYRIDGSVSAVNIGSNVHSRCLDYPLRTFGATDVEGLHWHDETFKLASTAATPADAADYARTALVLSTDCNIKNSTITDLKVDANGITSLVGLAVERSSESAFTSGMSIRNFKVTNGADGAGAYLLLPTTAEGLSIDGSQTFASYPTNAPVLNLNTVDTGDICTFDLDYEVTVDKSGSNTAYRSGRVRVNVMRAKAGNLTSVVTEIDSIADDAAGSGGGVLPAVTFAVTTAAPAVVDITVTSTLVAPITCVVKVRAFNFRSTGGISIKAA